MLEYYGNTLCIPAQELVEGGIMTESNYKLTAWRGKLEVVRHGKGKGNCALVAVDSLPQRYKAKVRAMYPEGRQVQLSGWLKDNFEMDQAAIAYYMNTELCGVTLGDDKIKEYCINASVLNETIRLYEDTKAVRRTMGEKFDWTMMSETVECLRQTFKHTLPSSMLRFRKKVNEYRRNGYSSLVSGKFGNQNTRKVDYKTEQVILSLACQPNKPWNTSVYEMYVQFVCGELDVCDPETGELFNPNDYCDKHGEPKLLSETTINNYLNAPKNQVLIAHRQESWTTFMHTQTPHVHRHAPEFSLSKVSFDDRDLPRKLRDTKMRPKAYYAYDVASQCVVGFAYNRNKTTDIVVDCFRSMFRLCERHGWGTPAQVEVENHLMSQWRESFLAAGTVFPFVRFCAPQNSQEKYAEPMNGAKKRSIEHKNHLGIGRFYAKGRHYRTEAKKVFDEKNDTYEDKQYYSWDELIAEDMSDVMEFNNSLHPNQKKYKGMTRWQVLEANINPTLVPYSKAVIAKYIGEHTTTSIRRNSYCRVNYKDWWISNTAILEKLSPNNTEVEAYWLPEEDGTYNEVYIYQNGVYIDTLTNVGTFNTADAEQTAQDKDIYAEQQHRIGNFRGYIKDNEIKKVGIIKHTEPETKDEDLLVDTIEEQEQIELHPDVAEDYARKALEDA